MKPSGLLFLFGGIFLFLVIVVAAAVFALAPAPQPPDCPDPNQVCDGPPINPPPVGGASPRPGSGEAPRPIGSPLPSGPGAPTAAPSPGGQPTGEVFVAPRLPNAESPVLRIDELYTSGQWGFGVVHEDHWQTEDQENGAFTLGVGFRSIDAQVNVRFDAADAGTVSPSQMLAQLEERYRGRIQSLAEDTSDANRALRPSIGLVAGEARTYRGTLGVDGGIVPVSLVIIVATDGRLTMAATVFTSLPDATFDDGTRVFRAAGFLVDPILKRFDWQVAQ